MSDDYLERLAANVPPIRRRDIGSLVDFIYWLMETENRGKRSATAAEIVEGLEQAASTAPESTESSSAASGEPEKPASIEPYETGEKEPA